MWLCYVFTQHVKCVKNTYGRYQFESFFFFHSYRVFFIVLFYLQLFLLLLLFLDGYLWYCESAGYVNFLDKTSDRPKQWRNHFIKADTNRPIFCSILLLFAWFYWRFCYEDKTKWKHSIGLSLNLPGVYGQNSYWIMYRNSFTHNKRCKQSQ